MNRTEPYPHGADSPDGGKRNAEPPAQVRTDPRQDEGKEEAAARWDAWEGPRKARRGSAEHMEIICTCEVTAFLEGGKHLGKGRKSANWGTGEERPYPLWMEQGRWRDWCRDSPLQDASRYQHRLSDPCNYPQGKNMHPLFYR